MGLYRFFGVFFIGLQLALQGGIVIFCLLLYFVCIKIVHEIISPQSFLEWRHNSLKCDNKRTYCHKCALTEYIG